jgi:hypothetical protein
MSGSGIWYCVPAFIVAVSSLMKVTGDAPETV